MSGILNQSRASARGSDYVWQYEYYDDEEPVSFEGLKAHRYSIVISFWVGLAVFVIFMFFVLTLLTKIGAPHQENPEPAERCHRLGNCMVDMNPQDENDQAFSRPLLDQSRHFFHFYISEEEQNQGQSKPVDQRVSGQEGAWPQRGHGRLGGISSSCGVEEMREPGEEPFRGLTEETKSDRESIFLSNFNIPNFVNYDHSSMLGEDYQQLCEAPVMLDSQSHSQDAHGIIS